jgi:two-component system phosphate regulon sensor histidine kinase PhoR
LVRMEMTSIAVQPPSDTRVKGFGLGLYYVKNICRAHHWKIRLQSEPGKGSVFYIEIPLE